MDKITNSDGEKIVIETRSHVKNGVSAILSSIAAILIVIIALVYLAEIDTTFKISWKSLTINGALIFVCSQAFHFVLKFYAQNKVRESEEYIRARKDAKEAIERLGKSEYSGRVNEYCKCHTGETIERIKSSILAPAGISYTEYLLKYIGKNAKELAEAFPEEHLTKNQVRAILRCNRIKVKPYDPNFLRECFPNPKENVEPSRRYRPEHDNNVETIRSAVTGLLLCVCVVNIGGDIVLNFSFATIVLCLVKLVATIISGVMGYRFGLNNMRSEIDLLYMKVLEAENCMEWCKQNPVQLVGKSDKLEPDIMLFGSKTEGYNK